MRHALADAAERSNAAEAAASHHEQRGALPPRDLHNPLVRIAALLDRDRLHADGVHDRDRILGEPAMRLGRPVMHMNEGDAGAVRARDRGRRLDAAPGVAGAIGGHQDLPEELAPLRWAPGHEHRHRCSVDRSGRGAAEQNAPHARARSTPDHEQIALGARVKDQPHGITAPGDATARFERSFRGEASGLLKGLFRPDGPRTVVVGRDRQERQLAIGPG